MDHMQHQQINFRLDSAGDGDLCSRAENTNVEEITNRLDQMNVDTNLVPEASANSGIHHNQSAFNGIQLGAGGEEMLIDNENVHPATGRPHQQAAGQQRANSDILIVTNVDPLIFSDQLMKAKFESLFTPFDERVLFRYLKSFRRVRLDFSSVQAANAARLNLNNCQLGSTAFKCYPAQMIRPNHANNNNNNNNSNNYNYNCSNTNIINSQYQSNQSSLDSADNNDMQLDDQSNTSASIYDNSDFQQQQQQQNNLYLSIPRQSKQFLISPPVSPPAGWRPHDESSPCIDVQLISAIANLVPGQVHEIHPGNESQPGIFVEVCEEKQFETDNIGNNTRRIPKTANPIAAARAAIGQAMRSS